MSAEQLHKAPAEPTDQVAERIKANFGVSKEAADLVSQNIGGEVHEINAPVEQLLEINDEVSIPTHESFMPEDRDAAGLSREAVQEFMAQGQSGAYQSEGIKIPEHIPEEQAAAYKKMAEAAIVRGMLDAQSVKAYNAALEAVAPVAMLHSRDDTENRRTSAMQVVRFNKPNGYPGKVEIVRNYDDNANETGLFIKAS